MTWMVVGGAGYIGRHVVAEMLARGHGVVVFDDLSAPGACAAPPAARFVRGCMSDVDALRRTMLEHGVAGVIHLAARKSVAESVLDPLAYYRSNLGGTVAVAEAAVSVGVLMIVHASSSAVYAPTSGHSVTEAHDTVPANPYGRAKLMTERVLADVTAAHGVRCVNLRLFNVAGAGSAALRDPLGEGLIPRCMDALLAGRYPTVYGRDYPTADGSAVRDFVHVRDVARAHALTAEALAAGDCRPTYNVGSGRGTTVLEVIEMIREVSGLRFPARIARAREGEVGSMIACTRRVREDLGWAPRHGVADIVRSEWLARTGPEPASVRLPAREADRAPVGASMGTGPITVAALP
jgi:UDP-glucose 4-epimerase